MKILARERVIIWCGAAGAGAGSDANGGGSEAGGVGLCKEAGDIAVEGVGWCAGNTDAAAPEGGDAE